MLDPAVASAADVDVLCDADDAAARAPRSPWLARAKVWGVLFLVQLAYCEWHVLAKQALSSGTRPLALALYRELGGVLVMHALARRLDGARACARETRALLRPHARAFAALALCAFANIVGFIVALQYITALNSALLHPVVPVLAYALGRALGVEPPARAKGVGVLLCAAGAVVVVLVGAPADRMRGASDPALGNALLLAQCCAMAALLVLEKPVLDAGLKPTFVTAWYYSGAALLTLAACAGVATARLARGDARGARRELVLGAGGADAGRAWAAAAFGALVAIPFVYVAMAWANARAGPSAVAASMTLQPPLNAALSALFLGRRTVAPGELAGGALVLAGLLCVVQHDAAPSCAACCGGRAAAAAPRGADDEAGNAELFASSATRSDGDRPPSST